MSLGGHARQTPDKGIHVPISWTFADASARAAFTPASGIPALEAQLSSEDLGKFAWDLDTDLVYILKSLNPTAWTALGGTSPTTSLNAGDGLSGGGDLTADRTFEVGAHADGSIVVNPDNIQVGVLATDAQHGARGGGTAHALVTTTTPGFMSDADKVKLNSMAAGASALTNTGPVNVTKAAAVVGVGTEAARHDHKHDVSTAAPGATGVATASGDGVATTLARSDHTHQANTAPVNVTKAVAAIGTSGEPARADHKHDVSTAAPGATGVATASGEGSATTLARSDHTHQSNTAPASVTKSTAVIGTSGQPARADHKHDVSTASAVALTDSTDAEGTATSLARSDHTHSHGARGGGTLHAVATTSVAGFMSPADKITVGRLGVISSASTGASSTSGATPITKASIIIPAENDTFIVEGTGLMSVSSTAAAGVVRLQNITTGTTLSTRVYSTSTSDPASVGSLTTRVEFIQTVAAGTQTVAMQYYIASGSGTITVSDVLVTARRKV